MDPEGWCTPVISGSSTSRAVSGSSDARGHVHCGRLQRYPAEIENLLLAHPAVSRVAVVGMPDERLGEVGMAFVVVIPAELHPEELIEWACCDGISGAPCGRDGRRSPRERRARSRRRSCAAPSATSKRERAGVYGARCVDRWSVRCVFWRVPDRHFRARRGPPRGFSYRCGARGGRPLPVARRSVPSRAACFGGRCR